MLITDTICLNIRLHRYFLNFILEVILMVEINILYNSGDINQYLGRIGCEMNCVTVFFTSEMESLGILIYYTINVVRTYT